MKKLAIIAGLSPLSAFAAVPAAVNTAITDAGTDAVTVATAVFVVLVGIFAVKLMRRGL
jgi:hypothetical protein